MDGRVTIAGIEGPSRDPAFLTVLAVHVAAGLVCVIAGATAAIVAKGRGRHSSAGLWYYRSLTVVFGSMSILTAMRFRENYHLFLIGLASWAASIFARRAINGNGPSRVRRHLLGMGASYTLLLIAFYVDNGHQLPLWDRLPGLAYWLIPGGIGAAIVAATFIRNPHVRLERDRQRTSI